MQMLISKAATRTKSGVLLELSFVDAKKAHLSPRCEQDVYLRLPDEANPRHGKCGKLTHWLFMFRPAQVWEALHAKKMEESGFTRGLRSSVAFCHEGRDLAVVVHGDDFTFSGVDKDLD